VQAERQRWQRHGFRGGGKLTLKGCGGWSGARLPGRGDGEIGAIGSYAVVKFAQRDREYGREADFEMIDLNTDFGGQRLRCIAGTFGAVEAVGGAVDGVLKSRYVGVVVDVGEVVAGAVVGALGAVFAVSSGADGAVDPLARADDSTCEQAERGGKTLAVLGECVERGQS
jgi:hypothetical protein